MNTYLKLFHACVCVRVSDGKKNGQILRVNKKTAFFVLLTLDVCVCLKYNAEMDYKEAMNNKIFIGILKRIFESMCAAGSEGIL